MLSLIRMLTGEEYNLIYQHAYLPEHLPFYVEGIAGAEPHLIGNYLCFTSGNHLIFIGYPLGNKPTNVQQAYESICSFFQPATVAIIAPQLWFNPQNKEEDAYYRLDLPLKHIPSEVLYMVRRARREVQVVHGKFGKEHQQLIKEFLSRHKVTAEQKTIFERISCYLKRSRTARLLEARRQNGTLVAFTITDLGSADFAFYLFNFRSYLENVPGASDLLFYEMVNLAQSEGKRAINLGLGIHPGVRHFKQKWGAVPFLSYTSCLIHRQSIKLETLIEKL